MTEEEPKVECLVMETEQGEQWVKIPEKGTLLIRGHMAKAIPEKASIVILSPKQRALLLRVIAHQANQKDTTFEGLDEIDKLVRGD
jgi:hypothetical protein